MERTVPGSGKITETTATLTCSTNLNIFTCSEPLGCMLASAKHCSYGYSTRLSQRQSEAALKACSFEIEGNLFDLWERSTCEGKDQGDAARGLLCQRGWAIISREDCLLSSRSSPGGLAPHCQCGSFQNKDTCLTSPQANYARIKGEAKWSR